MAKKKTRGFGTSRRRRIGPDIGTSRIKREGSKTSEIHRLIGDRMDREDEHRLRKRRERLKKRRKRRR